MGSLEFSTETLIKNNMLLHKITHIELKEQYYHVTAVKFEGDEPKLWKFHLEQIERWHDEAVLSDGDIYDAWYMAWEDLEESL